MPKKRRLLAGCKKRSMNEALLIIEVGKAVFFRSGKPAENDGETVVNEWRIADEISTYI